ncbi:MAG: hypothetical protein LBH44_11245 [Treponema sp.]|nr:hypothetical protein [Treponema sp.]
MNSKRILGLMAAMLLLMAAASSLWAQSEPIGFRESPQSIATRGRFRSAADDFIRSDSYAGLKLENWFAMTSFQNTDLALGFAKKLGNAYLGTYYAGSLLRHQDSTYTERHLPFKYDTKADNKMLFPVYGTDPYTAIKATQPNNRVAVLIGIADMGFRLSYASNHQKFSESDIAHGAGDPFAGTYYKNYVAEYGFIAPQLQWAMAKDLTKQGIRPQLTMDLMFFRDNNKVEKYTELDGKTNGAQINQSANYIEPRIELNLGGFTLYNENGFKGSVDLDYRLRLRSYDDNEYSWFDTSGKNKTASVNGTVTGSTVKEIDYAYNWIRPSASAGWSSGNVGVKAKLNLPLDFTSTETTTSYVSNDPSKKGKLIKEDYSDKFVFKFEPGLDLAVQYKIVPDKLTLNAGGRLRLSAITVTSDGSVEYEDEGKKEVPYSHENLSETKFDNTNTGLYVGANFNFTKNIWLEAVTGVSDGRTVGVFNDSNVSGGNGGLLVFSSFLAGLKF